MSVIVKADIVTIEDRKKINLEFHHKIVNKLATATMSLNDKVDAKELKTLPVKH
jgi:hypothetical protein